MAKREPTTSRARGYRVFISHATPDKRFARTLCDRLEALGIDTFRDDKDIDGGEPIPDRVRDELRACDEVVVLVTPRSLRRPWVEVEVGAAWGLKKLIVPIVHRARIEDASPVLRWLRAFRWREVDRYLAAVQARMEGRAS